MCRQYTIDEFTKTADLVKSRLEKPAITTDIIVGFPGETNSDFQQTVDLARHVGFAKMHVFPFSSHQDTPAAKMPKPVHNETVKHRSQVLRDLDNELGCQFRRQFIGQTATVLIEDTSNGIAGRCERYFMVSIENPTADMKKNDLVKVTLTKNNKTEMFAKV
jgi:threonylcarbamoyladenosine tRNA methylthiotransferase MtaB